MSDYLGDRRVGDTVDLKLFTTNSTGVPTTPVSLTVSVYKDNSATESTAGVTTTTPFDSRVGLTHVRITTVTDGTFYSAGSDFEVVATVGTVNAVSIVGRTLACFSIENRSAVMPSTAGRKLVVDAAGLADANVVKLGPTAGGTAQTARDLGLAIPAAVAGAAGGLFIAGTNAATTVTTALTTTFTGNLTGSVGSVTGAVGSVTGAVGSVTGAVGSVTGAVGSVTARVTADTDQINGSATAATNLKNSALVIYVGSVTGAVTTTTLIDSTLTQADTDFWKGRIIIFLTGTLKYQATDITAFDPATDKLTFTALTQAPAGADTYVVL